MSTDTNNHPGQLTIASCIQSFDDAFSPEFCAQMLASFGALSRFHRVNGKGVSAGHDSSQWVELDITPLTDNGFRDLIRDNMAKHLALYNQTLAQPIDVPPSNKLDQLVIKRYLPGGDQLFQTHFDALGPVSNRYLVFLWYLNDVEDGGETYFPRLDISVQPKAGRLLMFPPYWMFQHEGRAPRSNEKFIFSTYYLF
jgi:prolyl 4-hydroxylase